MPTISTHPCHDLRTLHGANIRRLMARLDMTLQQVVEATGLDERTVRSMSQGDTRPHARTLYKLAEGLGIDTDELFQDPFGVGNVEFDRATNPQVTQVIERHPEIFADWTDAEFAELYSRVAVGGELTEEGALAAAISMNARREVLYQASVILETAEADILREFIGMMFRRVTTVNIPSGAGFNIKIASLKNPPPGTPGGARGG
jgi:transcriptional regulator with XRE-family HTH domain